MFDGAKLLAASKSAVDWYKFRAHISFLSEVHVFKFIYVVTQRGWSIATLMCTVCVAY